MASTEALDATLFRRAINALGGRAIVRDMLRVKDRNVNYWLAGTHPIPPGIWEELLAEIRKRGKELSELEQQIVNRKE